jgi:hypothetical protein
MFLPCSYHLRTFQQNDVPSLMRAKIELETQYQMVQAHANKVEKKLAQANREKRGMLMLMHDVLLSQETDLLGKFLVFAANQDGIFEGNSPVDGLRIEDDETVRESQ